LADMERYGKELPTLVRNFLWSTKKCIQRNELITSI
jgi:hypothetical protein